MPFQTVRTSVCADSMMSPMASPMRTASLSPNAFARTSLFIVSDSSSAHLLNRMTEKYVRGGPPRPTCQSDRATGSLAFARASLSSLNWASHSLVMPGLTTILVSWMRSNGGSWAATGRTGIDSSETASAPVQTAALMRSPRLPWPSANPGRISAGRGIRSAARQLCG